MMRTQPYSAAPFRWARAKNTGPSHHICGLPCQDAVSVRTFADRDGEPWITAALSDGAGSAPHAEEGAAYAVQCFNEFIIDALSEFDVKSGAELENILRRGVNLVHETIAGVANNKARTVDTYAATFLGCVSRVGLTGFVQIGDGAIVIGETDDWQLAVPPYEGMYANTTCFVTDSASHDRLELKISENTPKTILMLSDGLEDLLIGGVKKEVKAPLPNLLSDALETSPKDGLYVALCVSLKELLQSKSVTSRSDDDTSIIAISHRQQAKDI